MCKKDWLLYYGHSGLSEPKIRSSRASSDAEIEFNPWGGSTHGHKFRTRGKKLRGNVSPLLDA